jgi:hypothetical protein
VVDHNIARINTSVNSTGFRIVNCLKGYFTQNTALSNSTNVNLNLIRAGFDVDNSGGSRFICNTAADLNTGFSFGAGNGTTTFAGNRMDNLRIGFELFETNVGIGNQGTSSILHLNSWLPADAPSPFTAHLRAVNSNGLNTRFNLSQSCNTQTTFYNPANFNSDLIGAGSPMPSGIPVSPCSTMTYFIYDNSANRPTDCFRHGGFAEPGSYAPLAESSVEERYLNRMAMIFEPDTFGLPFFSTEMKMETRHLYYDLGQDATTDLPSILVDFKDSVAQTDDGKMMILKQLISDIDVNDDSIYTFNNLSNKIIHIDSIFAIINSLTNADPIINREKWIYEWILSQKRSEAVIQRDYINTVLNSSNIDSMHVVFVSDPKNVVSVSLTVLDSIRAVANSCPYEWGEIVFTCRALNSRYDTLPYNINICESRQLGLSPRLGQLDESEAASSNNGQVIYPNPFSNQINYICLNEDSCGTLRFELYDITGRMLLRENKIAINGHYILQTTEVPSGVFFLRLFNNDQLVKSFKMIKL